MKRLIYCLLSIILLGSCIQPDKMIIKDTPSPEYVDTTTYPSQSDTMIEPELALVDNTDSIFNIVGSNTKLSIEVGKETFIFNGKVNSLSFQVGDEGQIVNLIVNGKVYQRDSDSFGSINSRAIEVQRGNTLVGIAHYYGVDVETIIKLNNLKSTTLKPGQILFIK